MEKAGFYYTGMDPSEAENYDRLYIGDEFCQKTLPSKKDMETAVALCSERGLSLTFVTSFLSDEAIEERLIMVDWLLSLDVNLEVVVNDWGFLEELVQTCGCRKIVLGRLLVSQYVSGYHMKFQYDKSLKKSKNREFYCHFPRRFMDMVKEKSVKRLEFNSIKHFMSVADQMVAEGIKSHVYFPYEYITVSRYCGYAVKGPDIRSMIVRHCSKQCRDHISLKKGKYFSQGIIIKGNTHFRTETIDPESSRIRPDRVVFNEYYTGF